MVEKVKLTETAVAALRPPLGASDVFYWDSEVAGFGLRVSPKGKKTWIAQYRFGQKQRRLKLGQWPELRADRARKAARDALAAARSGKDPQAMKAEARVSILTLGDVADRYIERHVYPRLSASSLDSQQRHLRREWAPLRDLPVNAVGRRHVADLLPEIAAAYGVVTANRARSTLSALYAWAIAEGSTEVNPVMGTNLAGKERTRERVLSRGELRAIWHATAAPTAYNRIVRLLTGQRRGEVGGMRWSELDLDEALWRLPAKRTKNGHQHLVPLPRQAVAILREVSRDAADDTAFGVAGRPFSGYSAAKRRLDARAGIGSGWTVHDLRRTAVTGMAELGVAPHVIEAVVNHLSGHRGGVAGIYNRAHYAVEKRAALQSWADTIEGIVMQPSTHAA